MTRVPDNGIYVLFEKGERAHGVDRIVGIGTHKGQNNLAARVREHLDAPNKDRSIFRKHVGRCLLAKEGDPFLDQWQLDLTTRHARTMNGHKVDQVRLKEVENDVTRYLTENFSFSVLRFDSTVERLHCKKSLLSTIFHCSRCGPSETWLGKFHPTQMVRESGLWNMQGLRGPELSLEEAERVVEIGAQI
ncbi:MAG TPA: hypothetical protein VGM96_14945 [Reyranella sp.]|jgi:hypothetical protein